MRWAILAAALLISHRAAADERYLRPASPKSVACSFRTIHGEPYAIPLRFEQNAPPFARVLPGAKVVMVVPAGQLASGSNLLVATAENGILVEGAVRLSDVELHPTTAWLVGGFLRLLPGARVELEHAQVGRLEFSYAVPEDELIAVFPNRRPRAHVPCTAVSLSVERFDLTEPGGQWAWLKGARRVPVSTTQGGPVVASIRAREPIQVRVLEQDSRWARILVERNTDAVVGWVPRGAIDHDQDRTGIGPGSVRTFGHAGGTGRGSGFGESTIRCPHSVPLIAEQGRRRHAIGRVRPKTTLPLAGWRNGDAEVHLPMAHVEPAEGTRFFLAKDHVRDCRVRKPPEARFRERRAPAWPRRSVGRAPSGRP